MDVTGEYVLYLVDTKKDRPFECPIEVFHTRVKTDIIRSCCVISEMLEE